MPGSRGSWVADRLPSMAWAVRTPMLYPTSTTLLVVWRGSARRYCRQSRRYWACGTCGMMGAWVGA